MVKTTSSVGLEPFDRLADKVQSLVGVLERTRAELTRTAEDNARLSREVDALRTQLATAEGQGAQAQSLRAERDQIRTRVTEMGPGVPRTEVLVGDVESGQHRNPDRVSAGREFRRRLDLLVDVVGQMGDVLDVERAPDRVALTHDLDGHDARQVIGH